MDAFHTYQSDVSFSCRIYFINIFQSVENKVLFIYWNVLTINLSLLQ